MKTASITAIVFLTFLAGCGDKDPQSDKSLPPESEGTRCVNNLKRINLALIEYKARKGQNRRYPREKGERFVVELLKASLLDDPRVLMCPSTGRSNTGIDLDKSPEQATDYIGIDNRNESENINRILRSGNVPASEIPIVWDRKGNHSGYRHVLFCDGHITVIYEEEFQEKFAKYE